MNRRFMPHRPLLLAMLALSCLTTARQAAAQSVYVAAEILSSNSDPSIEQFGTLNLATGIFTLIRDQTGGFTGAYGLAAANASTLYATDTNYPGTLYSINPVTGVQTAIGDLQDHHDVLGLAYTGGILYGLNPDEPNNLETINTGNATSVLLGSTGFDDDGTFGVGPDGSLYATEGDYGTGLYRVNPSTGAGTLLTPDLGAGTVNALATANGILYALASDGSIYSVNLTNFTAAPTGGDYDTSALGTIYAATGVPLTSQSSAPEPCSLLLALPLGGVICALSSVNVAVRKHLQKQARGYRHVAAGA